VTEVHTPTPPEDYGALFAHIDAAIDSRVAELDPGATMRVFDLQDHTTPNYRRNMNCWAKDFVAELTAISPWNSGSANQKGGCLISPRHYLHATHFAIPTGATVRFVKTDNTVVTRTVSANQAIAGTDFTVALLDSDVGAGISFAKVLPASAAAKLPSSDVWLPAASTDQTEDLTVRVWNASTSAAAMASFITPFTGSADDEIRRAFYKPAIGGDSGSPAFIFINSQLVLLTLWNFGGGGSGNAITANITAINAAMTALGGGYQLTSVNLSSYPDL
jgi:hypothetical protein